MVANLRHHAAVGWAMFPERICSPSVWCLLPTGHGEVNCDFRQFITAGNFPNPDGGAGVRKLLARNKFHRREHKTFDALNVLCV
jgi:hypothetical protein